MKKSKIFLFLLIIIVTCYCGVMVYVRASNNEQMTYKFYNDWHSNYIETKDGISYVNVTPHTSKKMALSEAQGYGMLITMLAAKHSWANQKDFHKLYRYYINHRDVIDHKQTQLMRWCQIKDNQKYVDNKNSATDGDLLIAESLIMASKKWPEHTEYKEQAQKLLNDILQYEYNYQNQNLTVGDWANKDSKFYNLIRCSDVMPTFFDDFYKFSGDGLWKTIKESMLEQLYQLSKQHSTGLIPDFAWVKNGKIKPVKPDTVATKYDGDYSANACRIPLTLSDSNDELSKKTLERLLKFFKKQQTVTAGYTLKGKPLNDYQSASFSAPIFVAVYCHKNKGYDQLFSSQQYIFFKDLPKNNYYDAVLTTIAALITK